MKVLFVNPACLDRRITDEDAGVIPIGLYYMAALLIKEGFDARILNLADPDTRTGIEKNTGTDSSKEGLLTFEDFIQREKPDLIGFSVTNPDRIHAQACATLAKKLLPNAWIIFGGPAPTFMAKHLFNACPAIDLMVKGEGETTILSLVKALAAGESVKGKSVRKIRGIALWEDGKLIETKPAEPVQDLDSLVHPSRYFVYQHLSMSRGCPGKCTFCTSPKFWGGSQIRRHSALWFAQEILALAQKGVTHFYISDDTFTMDRERVIEFCKLLISYNLNITWNAISRVDYIDENLLSWMRQAGCIQISFGVESGSPRIKKILGKPISDETCIKAFSLTRSYGIMPRAYFIYGSPGETDETIQESCDLLIRLKPLGTIFYLLVIFPGTHLYYHAKQKGLVTDEIWHEKIEDLPWFELDETLDFPRVKGFGDRLRHCFYEHLCQFATKLDLVDKKELYSFHSDFLSRLAMTFSHGEYADNPRIKGKNKIANNLFERALSYCPHPRAYLGMAMILQKEKNFIQAGIHLAKGLEHFPGNKELCLCMGLGLMNQSLFKDALPFFTPFRGDPGMDHYINICNSQLETP
jgi:anaerobic magnesium-protoporphyrin IX monomethyl ester cyclase